MGLSVVSLLEHSQNIPNEARMAIREGRLEEAGRILMETFELSCEDATELVNRVVCEPKE